MIIRGWKAVASIPYRAHDRAIPRFGAGASVLGSGTRDPLAHKPAAPAKASAASLRHTWRRHRPQRDRAAWRFSCRLAAVAALCRQPGAIGVHRQTPFTDGTCKGKSHTRLLRQLTAANASALSTRQKAA